MSASLQYRSSAITGNLAGKQLYCWVTPLSLGTAPGAGVYHIQPPVHDLVYGMVAVMTPADVVGGGVAGPAIGGTFAVQHPPRGVAAKFEAPGRGVSAKNALPPGGAAAKFEAPGGVAAKFEAPGGVAAKFEAPGRGVSAKNALPPGVTAKGTPWLSSASGSFVLSSRPIPGRNCLLIRSGFADLMDAVRAAGGAEILVV